MLCGETMAKSPFIVYSGLLQHDAVLVIVIFCLVCILFGVNMYNIILGVSLVCVCVHVVNACTALMKLSILTISHRCAI